jgi:hypothetical protein
MVAVPLNVDAQVTVSGPIRFTGPPDERRIDSLAWPQRPDALVTVEAAVLSGGFSWSQASLQGDTIALVPDPVLEELRDGLLLRFVSPGELAAELFVRPGPGHPALPLLRPDGLLPVRGQLLNGRVVEIMKAGDRFILLSSPESGCPPGTLEAHQRLCMDVVPVSSTLFHDAVAICAARGGKLCAWDEYIAACNLLQVQLSSMFVDWEWIDDSSNHTHGADQAGRFTCISQRNQGVLDERLANVRCCYHPR